MATEEFESVLSAYSPQAGGDQMEGGYEASRPGLDGQAIVRTLTGVANKVYDTVTLAGHPENYGNKYVIPKITFINKEGKSVTLKNVKAYVHDTGSAFKTEEARNEGRFDIAVAKDMKSSLLDQQPFSMKKIKMVAVDDYSEYHESLDDSFKIDDKFDNTTDNTKTQLPWIDTAVSLLGIEEYPGNSSNKKILAWAQEVGVEDDYTDDSIPWCGLFVSYCLVHNGIKPSASPLWALSWKDWGTELTAPAYGCLLVFKRTGGGHVGWYISEDDDYYHVLGGNQSDMVCVTKVAKANCVAWRWPTQYMDRLKKGRIKKVLNSKISDSADLQ